jgi:hypothetical protein
MLARLRPRSAYDVMAMLALFVAISTGGAYAANTVFSSDIVDGEVKNADIGFDAVTGSRIANNAIQTQDIQDFTITGSDFGVNTIGSSKIQNDTLTGDDVLETSLNPLQFGKVADSHLVDGYDASAIARVGRGSSGATSSFFTFSNLSAVTITAPRDGFVLVNASAHGSTSDPDCAPCYLHLQIRDDTSGDLSQTMFESVASGELGTLSSTWVFPVQTGQRTFTLQGAAAGGFGAAENVSFGNSEITALFTPFGSVAGAAQASRSTSRTAPADQVRQRSGAVRRR